MILVDTDVLIAHLRGSPRARNWLVETRRQSGPLRASCVTATEITGGMRSPERGDVRRLLGTLRLLDVDEQVAYRAGEFMRAYRRSHSGIGLGDYLIAATADVRGLRLATLNVRHFPMLAGLTAPFSLE
ncbi:MAG: type II toxin-antitoxin system VapC family toxin [Actinobacteria bacterium]|nr:type II toxin-antitoxin system VapC family toxin [Actinomycetota bacterium]